MIATGISAMFTITKMLMIVLIYFAILSGIGFLIYKIFKKLTNRSIKASTAQEKSEEIRTKKQKQERSELSKTIWTAIGAGHKNCHYVILFDENVQKLRDLGYRVELKERTEYGFYNPRYYLISWDIPKEELPAERKGSFVFIRK